MMMMKNTTRITHAASNLIFLSISMHRFNTGKKILSFRRFTDKRFNRSIRIVRNQQTFWNFRIRVKIHLF